MPAANALSEPTPYLLELKVVLTLMMMMDCHSISWMSISIPLTSMRTIFAIESSTLPISVVMYSFVMLISLHMRLAPNSFTSCVNKASDFISAKTTQHMYLLERGWVTLEHTTNSDFNCLAVRIAACCFRRRWCSGNMSENYIG